MDTNAEKNLMQRRLNAYETEGGAAGGGDVFDLKEKVRLLEERGLRHAQERDEALGKARDLEWRLKESQTKYGTSQRFRSAEQKRFEELQKSYNEALESVADERKATKLVKTANEEKRLLREAEFGRKVLLAASIWHTIIIDYSLCLLSQMSSLETDNIIGLKEVAEMRNTLIFQVRCGC